ncbi:hypothetical protein GWI33_022239 [Rhynchophorus ferrugineus]|uniref:Uncharacterized protein n=1 Tax=Rhynchophorus ferrugineus TaxID=354439 RepID=A0A834HPX8_RHYFE|nr:hypothetical protein GWI33_022240 [Rhynchophorus ferrugineus]KAF7264818.1 hypothetical protein GWI33_022239 [Rhynchophorus ferrugineus]
MEMGPGSFRWRAVSPGRYYVSSGARKTELNAECALQCGRCRSEFMAGFLSGCQWRSTARYPLTRTRNPQATYTFNRTYGVCMVKLSPSRWYINRKI